MPTISLETLSPQPELVSLLERIPDRGLVLTTGQTRSGKHTILMAIAFHLARGRDLVMLSNAGSDEFGVFQPFPPNARLQEVAPDTASWEAALGSLPAGAIPITGPLTRSNAAVVLEAATQRLVFATLDTALIGADAAYALDEMGVPPDRFVSAVACIWSQMLLEALCEACAVSSDVTEQEAEALFPAGGAPAKFMRERGCEACNGLGTQGMIAACEAFVIDDKSRMLLTTAVHEGAPLALPADAHVSVHELARRHLAGGRIGIRTYRNAILRNPLLRAQNSLEREQAYSQRLGRMFRKFVSPEVQRRLLDSRSLEAVVRGESREVSCLFCDIRGFTARAEAHSPQDLFADLNRYFAVVVDAVLENEGTIDKFIGDAVMVVFGAPLAQPDHAARALRCALAIRERIDSFNAAGKTRTPIVAGIGVNSGTAVAGCVGTDARMEYTVLGDTVNVAARLEARAAARQILVSGATRAAAGTEFEFRAMGEMALKGRSLQIEVHELVASS